MFKKRLFTALLAVLMVAGVMQAANPKREWRSLWLTTVWCIDWPSSQGISSSHQSNQKKEMIAYLDLLAEMKMTSTCFQVRSMCDAMYKSSYEPWSSYLTGERGVDPGWDPLAFVVEECHKRGIECYAWVNPYRWSTGSEWNTEQDQQLHADGMILTYNTTKILNPAMKESRERIVNVCKEIITNYKIDGILFDDYFYPNGIPSTSSAEDYNMWKNSGTSLSIGDWRRANVNQMVKDVYDMIQENRPDLRFGISPAGVSGKYNLHGLSTKCPVGSDWQYNGIFSDPIAWLAEGTVDFISPQLYWKTTHSSNPFGQLTKWWSYAANAFNRHHYASMTLEDYANSNTTSLWEEHAKQINLSRQYTENSAPGACFYSTHFLRKNESGLANYLIKNTFNTPALTPHLTWKKGDAYEAVKNLKIADGKMTWDSISNGNAIIRYTVYAIPTSVSEKAAKATDGDGYKVDYLQGVTYSPEYAIPADKRIGYWYAVCVFDGYGKEHTPATTDFVYDGPEPGADGEFYDNNGTVSVECVWFKTVDNGGITFAENGGLNRAFCAVGDYVYIAGREANSSTAAAYLRKINGATGEKVGDIKLGAEASVGLYPCNDVIKDQSGNVCVTNLTTNAKTTPVKVHLVNLETGALTEVASLIVTSTIPNVENPRIDHVALWGDVPTGKFTVYAAISSSASVVRWNFEGGTQVSEQVCTVAQFYPETATDFGTAPRVVPASTTAFYIDGGNTAWSRYLFANGRLSESFTENKSLSPTSYWANGGTFFTLNNMYYMTYSSADDQEGYKFTMASSSSKNMSYDTMNYLWTLPRNGMGTTNSGTAQASVDYVQVGEDMVRVYYYVPGVGLCAYEIKDSAASGVEETIAGGVSIVAKGNTVTLSEVAQQVGVYNMMGALVASANNVDAIEVNAPAGIYIAVAMVNGKSYKQKVVLK